MFANSYCKIKIMSNNDQLNFKMGNNKIKKKFYFTLVFEINILRYRMNHKPFSEMLSSRKMPVLYLKIQFAI